LSYKGLATCALNSNLSIKNINILREGFNVGTNEQFIIFIAVGHYPDSIIAPISKRSHYKEYTKYLNIILSFSGQKVQKGVYTNE
jgi:hypothetical protein